MVVPGEAIFTSGNVPTIQYFVDRLLVKTRLECKIMDGFAVREFRLMNPSI